MAHPAFWELGATIDHLIPVTQGGKNDESNLVTTSMARNAAKLNYTIEQLGWTLRERGDFEEWDGLLRWFLQYPAINPRLLENELIHRWYQPWRRAATLAATAAINGSLFRDPGDITMRRHRATVAAAAGISLILLGTVAAQDPVKPPDNKGPTAEVPAPTERFKPLGPQPGRQIEPRRGPRRAPGELRPGRHQRRRLHLARGGSPGGSRPAGSPGEGKGQGPAPTIPDSVRVELDVPYAATDNPRQRLDLYVPKAAKSEKPLPLVVFIHGGAFRAGDKRSGWPMIARLRDQRRVCRRVGRLSPERRDYLAGADP